jgi:ketosteroid isomerase-like protein
MIVSLMLAAALLQPLGSPPVDHALLARLEADWNDAHLNGDTAVLERLFADDLIVLVPGMRALSKEDSLNVVRSARIKFNRYETTQTTFRVYGTSAIATGRLRRTRVVAGSSVDDDWWFTKVYVYRAGRWSVVSFHASNTAP